MEAWKGKKKNVKNKNILGADQKQFKFQFVFMFLLLGFSSIAKFPNIGANDIWGHIALCCGGVLNIRGFICTITGLHPLSAGSYPCLSQPKMSSDVVKCSMGGKIALLFLVENHCSKNSLEEKEL